MMTRPIDGEAPQIRGFGNVLLKWPELGAIVLARENDSLAPEDPWPPLVLRWLHRLADQVSRNRSV